MNIEHFEEEFPDLYTDFGYRMNPKPSPLYEELLDAEMYDEIIQKAETENIRSSYYVKLTWKTLEVGIWGCTQEEYESQIIPQQVINAARTYAPPVFD